MVVGLLCTLAAVIYTPAVFMVDDAWFYLQIGRNLGLGLGSTFDGEVATNGYHPLWQAVVGLLAHLSTDRGTLLNLALGTQVIAVCAALPLLLRTGERWGVPFPIVVPAALLITQYSDKGWLSEGPITALFLAAVLSSLHRPGVRTGFLLGLLFLTRLDTVFFVGALLLFTPRRRAILLGAGVVAGPWLLWNLWTWGHLLPISGAIKSTFPHPDFADPLAKIGWMGLATGIGSGVALLFAARRPGRRVLLGSLGLGGLAHAVYTALFTGPLWSTFVPYYWIVATIAAAMALGELLAVYLEQLPSLSIAARRSLIGASVVLLSLAAAGRALRSVFQEPDPTILMARWIEENLPESRILVLDAPGRIAWFSGRPVFAMDGLTRNWSFSEDLDRLGIETWANKREITHLLGYDTSIELPWCAVQSNETALVVRFRSPRRGTPVGERTFDRDAALKRLTDFVPTEVNVASLHRWERP